VGFTWLLLRWNVAARLTPGPTVGSDGGSSEEKGVVVSVRMNAIAVEEYQGVVQQ
jgi:hypothetical protein